MKVKDIKLRLSGLLLVFSLIFVSTGWTGGVEDAKAGFAALERGDYDEAIKLCTKAIESGELWRQDLAATYLNRAVALIHKEEYDRAIADCNRAVEIDPNSAKAFYGRGNAWLEKGDNDRAIVDYNLAINLDPNYSDAYDGRGIALDRKGQYDQAISDFNKAIKLNPKAANTFCNRGNAWAKRGDYDTAIADFTRAIKLNPKYGIAYYNRATIWKKKGDYDKAIADYSRAIESGSLSGKKLSKVYGTRGFVYFNQALFSLAEPDLEAYLRLNPKAKQAKYIMLWLYIARERVGKDAKPGLAVHAKKIDLNKWPGPIFSLFFGYITPEKLIEETKDKDKKIEKGRRCETFFYLGQYHLLRGEKDQAMKMFGLSLDTEMKNFVEYKLAKLELERMKLEN